MSIGSGVFDPWRSKNRGVPLTRRVALRTVFCTTVWTVIIETKVASLNVRKSQSATNNSCCCVSESVITHCSPDAVMSHFKTSFLWTVASDQFHCKHNGKTSNDQRPLYLIVLRVTSAMHTDEGRFVCVELKNVEIYSHTYFRRDWSCTFDFNFGLFCVPNFIQNESLWRMKSRLLTYCAL